MNNAQRMMSLFAGHECAHGTHGEPLLDVGGLKWEIKTTARTLREPVTLEMWEDHLAGRRPLGVVPIRQDSTCLWGSIDDDRYDVDQLPLMREVERRGMPLVPGRSKSGGLHLFIFCAEPIPAPDMRAALSGMAAALGLARAEIFPKQSEVRGDRGDVGNWMVMPYYGDTFNGRLREQVGLTSAGLELTLEQFLDRAEAARVTADQLLPFRCSTIPRRQSDRAAQPPREDAPPTDEPFSDGPPCLQHISMSGVPQDHGRNVTLFMMGVYARRARPGRWQDDLAGYNQRFMQPPLSDDEMRGLIRSLSKKQYEYTCRSEPMMSHCNSTVCRSRQFGVGGGGQIPSISGISKLMTEPAIWFLDVDGVRYEARTEQLMNYSLMQRLFAEQGTRVYKNMKASDWTDMLFEAMQQAVCIDAPPDVSGQFHEALEDFLSNMWQGARPEDIHRGKPWLDEDGALGDRGMYYFRIRDLMDQLSRSGIRDMDRAAVSVRLRTYRAEPTFITVGEKRLGVWRLPASAVDGTPELPAPDVRDSGAF